MATFSWSDTFKIAFQSCLPCLRPSASDTSSDAAVNDSNTTASRSDELQGLLADVSDTTDNEADSMSLHSNPGHRKKSRRLKNTHQQPRKNNNKKIMSLFGYHLFGRHRPSIQLGDDSEDALYVRRRRGIPVTPHNNNNNTTYSNSSSTFDSVADAAPLDTEAIDALSAAVIEAADVEAQRLWVKEERRERRRRQQQAVGDETKGIQGSGDESQKPSGFIPIKNGSESGSSSGSGSKLERTTLQREGAGGGGEDVVDLDGEIYARNASQGDSNRGSDSRSRRTSMGDPMAAPNLTDPPSSKGPSKPGKSRSSRSSQSRTSATTSSSQSPPPPSPLTTTFAPESQHIVSPSTVERGLGFFDLEDGEGLVQNHHHHHHQESATAAAYFPITGFGGATGGRKKASSMGAFLAQRG